MVIELQVDDISCFAGNFIQLEVTICCIDLQLKDCKTAFYAKQLFYNHFYDFSKLEVFYPVRKLQVICPVAGNYYVVYVIFRRVSSFCYQISFGPCF